MGKISNMHPSPLAYWLVLGISNICKAKKNLLILIISLNRLLTDFILLLIKVGLNKSKGDL